MQSEDRRSVNDTVEERATELLEDLGGQLLCAQDPEAVEQVVEALKRERQRVCMEIEALAPRIVIPPQCMEAANVLLAQFREFTPAQWEAVKEDGAFEAVAINVAWSISRALDYPNLIRVMANMLLRMVEEYQVGGQHWDDGDRAIYRDAIAIVARHRPEADLTQYLPQEGDQEEERDAEP